MLKYGNKYKKELFENVIPFWMRFSKDSLYGGFFTSLDREGKVFDTDKFMWLQGRQVWMLSTLYNRVRPDHDWLQMAKQGAGFMLKNGRDAEGNWYFSLDRQGKPLVQPYNIFSDCFAAMGLSGLYTATGQDEYGQVARDTFLNILKRRENPKGKYNKTFPGTRDLKGFSLPMILSNLSLELEHLLDPGMVDTLIDEVIHEVMDVFYQKDRGLILESVYADGSFCDSYEGRLVNPGHILEAMWFMMDLAVRKNDTQLIEQCVEIALRTMDYGWDKEFGGLFYFMDIENKPLVNLEWDQKLWWVHVEALVCMAKAWQLTGNEKCLEWFKKLDQYSFQHFSDPQFGEWFGYLNRRGEVLINAKGGKWKGCFHVPRGLMQVYQILEKASVAKEAAVTSSYQL